MNKLSIIALCVVGSMPIAVSAQDTTRAQFGPSIGDREFSLSGTGSSDKDFDNGTFGVTGDLGWYYSDQMVLGIRQSLNYANIKGESLKDDFWNGSTRGYLNYHFGEAHIRPFVGGSLGLIYGDGVKDSGFTGLEGGAKYYVLPNTYLLGRVEYQWFFDRSSDADDAFKDGAWAYTVGMGYNF